MVAAGDLIARLRECVASAGPEVVAVYLHGSRARGTAHPGSDVDLGVLLRSPGPPRLRDAARAVEALVEPAVGVTVEAVALNAASPDLVHRVLRDGVLLLDRDKPARLRFEVQARNAYFDMEPIRRRYRKQPA
jgi:predicted nucleotidyltransferase